MEKSAIVIMAKQPRAGKTKTRLCPPFTPEDAALLFECLMRDSIALVAGMEDVDLAVAISPPESETYFQTIVPAGTLLLPIEGANIGVCLQKALAVLLELGYAKAMAMNADGPSLPWEYLAQAVAALDDNDLVFGPDEDGGYYLVGLKQSKEGIFENIPWSTAEVLEKSLAQAQVWGLQTVLTPPWYDVDTPADVQRLRNEMRHLADTRLVHTRQFFKQHPVNLPG